MWRSFRLFAAHAGEGDPATLRAEYRSGEMEEHWQEGCALRYHEDGAILPDVEQGKQQRENL